MKNIKNGYFLLRSSLLHSILGEIPTSSGFIETNGLISYAPQEPWVFSGSVRQNIIFGQSFEEDRYMRVIEVCALEYDLKIWKDYDNTLVGERGVILSGWKVGKVLLILILQIFWLTQCRWSKGQNQLGPGNLQRYRYLPLGWSLVSCRYTYCKTSLWTLHETLSGW